MVFQPIKDVWETCDSIVSVKLLKSNITQRFVWELTDTAGLWICHGTFMIDVHSSDSPVLKSSMLWLTPLCSYCVFNQPLNLLSIKGLKTYSLKILVLLLFSGWIFKPQSLLLYEQTEISQSFGLGFTKREIRTQKSWNVCSKRYVCGAKLEWVSSNHNSSVTVCNYTLKSPLFFMEYTH